MYNVNQQIEHLAILGNRFGEIGMGKMTPDIEFLIDRARINNAWFTQESIQFAFQSLSEALTEAKIRKWLSDYLLNKKLTPKTIGLVLAGNIPLVGLHDILCVLASGNRAVIKLSVKDQELYHVVKKILIECSPEYDQLLNFTEGTISDVDAIIATGSNNSSRYFEYYFGKYPHIIRKNRTSVAVLDGSESDIDLKNLGSDIFTYFGLGCRNVSHLLVPKGYSFDRFLKAIEPYRSYLSHNKYTNNYEYQRVVALMNQMKITDTGFVLLEESPVLQAPISTIHYHFYEKNEEVVDYLKMDYEKIQCIITSVTLPFTTFAWGMAQKPELSDYADHVDTLSFLLNLK
jgi:hypothetical protein